jgi:peptidoglycan/LPS O-acetylase OafA/YrhL
MSLGLWTTRGLAAPEAPGTADISGSPAQRPVNRSFATLQASRAVAALLVVLFHNSQSIFALPKYWHEKPFGNVFDFGDSGVFFFFVLSGFIIFYAHCDELNRPGRLTVYLWKRFRRIYPIYWIILLCVLPAYLGLHAYGKGYETRPEVIVSSVLLIHLQSDYAVIIPSWTLFHEILFYALFGVAIWRSSLGLPLLLVWMTLSVFSIGVSQGNLLTDFYFAELHWLFGFGMAAAWLVRSRAIPGALAFACCGLAGFMSAGADESYLHFLPDSFRMVMFGVASTMIVLGLVELERSGRMRVPGWLVLLGDASYAIYLVHFLALSLLAKLAWSSGAARLVPAQVAYVVLAVLAVGAGTLCHLVVERPILSVLGRFSPVRPSHP